MGLEGFRRRIKNIHSVSSNAAYHPSSRRYRSIYDARPVIRESIKLSSKHRLHENEVVQSDLSFFLPVSQIVQSEEIDGQRSLLQENHRKKYDTIIFISVSDAYHDQEDPTRKSEFLLWHDMIINHFLSSKSVVYWRCCRSYSKYSILFLFSESLWKMTWIPSIQYLWSVRWDWFSGDCSLCRRVLILNSSYHTDLLKASLIYDS